MISTNYASPVMVNGYSCRNCSEVDLAKKNIDPDNPQGGPFQMNDTGRTARSNHFSPEARDLERLEQLHRARTASASPAASAYASAQASAPALVNLTL